jgi:hypothetical protein
MAAFSPNIFIRLSLDRVNSGSASNTALAALLFGGSGLILFNLLKMGFNAMRSADVIKLSTC